MLDASRDRFLAFGLSGSHPLSTALPSGDPAADAGSEDLIQGAGMPFRPTCDAGFESPGSTSLKWGRDGELTPQDLHLVLARLLVHDQEACRMMDGDPSSPFG